MTKFKAGDKIIICSDLADTTTIQEGTLESINETIVKTDIGIFFSSCCWPIEYKSELIQVVSARQALKKVYDESISLVYKLRNKVLTQS